jgi:anti-sigma B factor antagonist
MLQTSTHTIDDVIIVDCRGRIVLGDETANLRHLVKDLMNESPRIVVNLAEVTQIDSNGIGTLFGLYISAEKAGAKMKLAGLGGHAKSVSEITKLAMACETFPTVEEAIASFAPAVMQAKAG